MPRRDRTACVNTLLRVLLDPCCGVRLVDSPDEDADLELRWSEFCKVECPRFARRIIYRFVSDGQRIRGAGRLFLAGPVVIIEAVGPHKRRGDPDDVYTMLRRAYEVLPDDAGHARARQAPQPCCDPSTLDDELRSSSSILDARDALLR